MTEEAALVEAFLDGRDERAFRALYRAATPAAYGLALRLAGGDVALWPAIRAGSMRHEMR